MKDKKIDFFLVFFIVLVGLIFRLYKINSPLADYHSWRQADTAAVARNFVKNKKIDFFHPQYDDLSRIQSGKENPQGYRMVEFPFYQGIIAYLYLLFPKIPLEVYGRLISVLFTLITTVVIYFILIKEVNRTAAFFSAFTFVILPFFVFFTRTILPESTALGLTFLSIFFLYLFSKISSWQQWIMYFFSLVFFSLSLLVKPTTIFYIVPLLYLFYLKRKKKLFLTPSLYLYFFALLPLIFWRLYINQFPDGIPANEWLITSVNTPQGLKNIFFRPAFFRWIFFERINILILGGYLTFFFVLGTIVRQKNFFLHSFLGTMFFYLFTFQGGNVQHEYYQIIIFPILAIFVGLGVNNLFIFKNKFIPRLFLVTLVFLLYGFSFYFSYDKVKNYYHIPKDLIYTASIIRFLTKENDYLLTDTIGDTTLLYLANRRGYPAVYEDLSYFKNLGVKYFYTSNNWVIEDIMLKNLYPLIFKNNQFALFRL